MVLKAELDYICRFLKVIEYAAKFYKIYNQSVQGEYALVAGTLINAYTYIS